jgi:PhoD related phosphatase
MLVSTLQAIAVSQQVRVSFVAGDVHCPSVAQFYSDPKAPDLAADPRFMPQIVRSATAEKARSMVTAFCQRILCMVAN